MDQVQPLTKSQLNTPHWLAIVGSIVLFIGGSLQKGDIPSEWGNAVDWSKLGGAIVAVYGIGRSILNTNVQQKAIEDAAVNAPVDANGEQSTDLTLRAAYDQAIAAEEHLKATAIHNILIGNFGDAASQLPDPPKTLGKVVA